MAEFAILIWLGEESGVPSLLMLCVHVSNMSHVSLMNLHGDQVVPYLSV